MKLLLNKDDVAAILAEHFASEYDYETEDIKIKLMRTGENLAEITLPSSQVKIEVSQEAAEPTPREVEPA